LKTHFIASHVAAIVLLCALVPSAVQAAGKASFLAPTRHVIPPLPGEPDFWSPPIASEAAATPGATRGTANAPTILLPHQSPPDAPRASISGARLPAEFEPHETLLLASADLATTLPELLLDIVSSARGRIDIAVLVRGEHEKALIDELVSRRDLPRTAVRVLEVRHDTMWVRDYGPIFVSTEKGARLIVDGDYLQYGRPQDDSVPMALASAFRAAVVHAPAEIEGGNLLSNGRGLLVTTTASVGSNEEHGLDEAELRDMYRRYLGATHVVFLEPLAREATGHVDMFAAFTAADTVVVGQYRKSEDPENAAILDRNAERLAGLPTSAGPLKVVRIPMPSNEGDVFRTYTNGIFANGVYLVPVYPGLDVGLERRALDVWRGQLPDWKIVGVDASVVIESGGALHCLSMTVPAATDVAHPRSPERIEPPVSSEPPNTLAPRRFSRRLRPL
jgi:agmatine/peptidylarginine deiminase